MDQASQTWPIHPITILPPFLSPQQRHLLSPPRYRKVIRRKLGTADGSHTLDSFLMYALPLPLMRKPPAAAEAVPSNKLASRKTDKALRASCRCATTMALLLRGLNSRLFGLVMCMHNGVVRKMHAVGPWILAHGSLSKVTLRAP